MASFGGQEKAGTILLYLSLVRNSLGIVDIEILTNKELIGNITGSWRNRLF